MGFARFLAAAAVIAGLAAPAAAAEPAVDNGAVVIMYHRFGDDRYPSTNIRMEQFKKHVAELKKDKYTVLPLREIVAALRNDEPLPDRAVAITVDDAYKSVFENAWPVLREAGFPFTLFVATDPVDQEMASYMSWDQVRTLAQSDLVTIGNHSRSHPHMPAGSAAANRAEVAKSQARFKAELGEAPELFAYPYGEYSDAVKKVVREADFTAAFGQHSGGIGRLAGRFELPRYALNEAYGSMDRFTLAVNSLPLPVTSVTPDDNKLTPADNPPMYGFTVHDSIASIDGLNCFASGRGEVTMKKVTPSRVEVRMNEPFPQGRARINCTLQGPEGRWRWFGNQFFVAGE